MAFRIWLFNDVENINKVQMRTRMHHLAVKILIWDICKALEVNNIPWLYKHQAG